MRHKKVFSIVSIDSRPGDDLCGGWEVVVAVVGTRGLLLVGAAAATAYRL
jgi:hypothetical protein